MTNMCSRCDKQIEPQAGHMTCKGCNGDFHFDCGGWKKSSWQSSAINKGEEWRCGKCKGNNPANNTQPEDVKDELSGQYVMKALNGFKDIVEKLKEENFQIMQYISKQYDDIMEGQKDIGTNMKNMEDQIINLTAQKLKEKDDTIMDLQTRIAQLEQYTRKNNIAIHGVEERSTEDVEEIVCNIGQAIGIQISAKDIETAHRIPTRRSDVPKPIVVRFQSRKTRNQFLAKKKTHISNRQVVNKPDAAEGKVLFYEQLSPFNKDLMWKLKKQARDKG